MTSELLQAPDMLAIVEKWMTSETSMSEDLITWGIDPTDFEQLLKSYINTTLDEILKCKLKLGEGFLDLFIAGFQLGYLFRLEVESRTMGDSDDDVVLGLCPHGVNLDREFCPHGCRR